MSGTVVSGNLLGTLMVHKVLRERRVKKEILVRKELLETKVKKVRRVPQVIKDKREK